MIILKVRVFEYIETQIFKYLKMWAYGQNSRMRMELVV